MRRDAVLEADNQPNGWGPLVKAETRYLKDGADLEREMTLASTALPDATARNEDGVTIATTRESNDTVGPTQAPDELESTVDVRKVADGLNEGVRHVWSGYLHHSIFPEGCAPLP
jgi:hypothetical protein